MYPNQMLELLQLIPLDSKKQRLYSELPFDDGAPHPFSKAELSYSMQEGHVGCLYTGSHSFVFDTNFMTVGEDWNVDRCKSRALI